MLRYLDFDSWVFSRRRTATYPVTREQARYGGFCPVQFQFVRGSSPFEPEEEVSGRFLLKKKGGYNASSFIVETVGLVKSGSGEDAIFSFYPNFSGVALQAALSPNLDYVDLVAEIEVTIGDHDSVFRTLNPFEYRVYNSPNRGNESPVNYPEGSAVIQFPSVTGLTGGTDTDLDAIPLAAYAPLTIFEIAREIDGATSSSRWQKVAGNNLTDVDAGIIRTLDYNASTNPYVLVRVSGL